jgi:hypothetical protein
MAKITKKTNIRGTMPTFRNIETRWAGPVLDVLVSTLVVSNPSQKSVTRRDKPPIRLRAATEVIDVIVLVVTETITFFSLVFHANSNIERYYVKLF